jgi:hypothetical protein
MGKRAANQFRERISKELRDAATMLDKAQVCRDIGPLLTAANKILRSGGNNWSYEITNLLFFVSDVAAYPPSLGEITCRLTVNAAGLCVLEDNSCDPMTRLQIDIILEATALSAQHRYLQSWHFDRHEGGTLDSINPHPRYHINFGGRFLEKHAKESKMDFLLLLDSPRIMHPPLDGVLALDFVLANFAAGSWNRLRTQRDYITLMREVQGRIWKPFALALNANWPVGPKTLPWQCADVCPQFC